MGDSERDAKDILNVMPDGDLEKPSSIVAGNDFNFNSLKTRNF